MNYSEMSDFEINEAVSMALLPQSENPDARYVAIGNYCNSWADAGPIIQENDIGLIAPFAGEEPAGWTAYDPLSKDRFASHDNPTRAAMVVFLMMQERPNA